MQNAAERFLLGGVKFVRNDSSDERAPRRKTGAALLYGVKPQFETAAKGISTASAATQTGQAVLPDACASPAVMA